MIEVKIWAVISDYLDEPAICSIHSTLESAVKECDIINDRFAEYDGIKHAYYRESVLKLGDSKIFDENWVFDKE